MYQKKTIYIDRLFYSIYEKIIYTKIEKKAE
jgi:hypothetical protein